MKIAILRERAKFEQRVAITPEVTKLLVDKGYTVIIEKDAGNVLHHLEWRKIAWPVGPYQRARRRRV